MGENKDTEIRKPDGALLKGEKVGSVDKESRIFNSSGNEIGYVDKDNNVHLPDGKILRGEVVGKIKDEKTAYASEGLIIEEWGYIDNDDNIHQKDGMLFRGRIIGKIHGDNKAGALGYYILRFKELEKNADQLQKNIDSDNNKVKYLYQIQKMLEYISNADALGDFERLLNKLKQLEAEVKNIQTERRYKKEELCQVAESLSNSKEWKTTHIKFIELKEKWKAVGFTGNEFEEMLWNRFRSAQDIFYQNRKTYFDKLNQDHQDNRKKKEILCLEAESLSNSTEWKVVSEKMKELQMQWKQIGSAGREYEDVLFQRFRSTQDKFFEKRNLFYKKLKIELNENLKHKEHLCELAESLVLSNDLKSAREEIKSLQAKWKEIGHVPREFSDSLFQRFRKACDEVFEHSRREYERKHEEWESKQKEWKRKHEEWERKHEEWERKQDEWRKNLREVIERKQQQINNLRESIEHDEGLIERWKDIIANLYDGRRADEIRDSLEGKISDVEDKIQSKENRISELKEAIRDMESKLRN